MKTVASLSLLVVVGFFTGCAADSAPTEDSIESQTAALYRPPPEEVEPPMGDPPPPPGTPVPKGKLVRITSSELESALSTFLLGTRMMIDTTRTSQTIWGQPEYICSYPNKPMRDALLTDCAGMNRIAQRVCRARVDAEYPNIKECHWAAGQWHSYIDFGGAAETMGAQDVTFSMDTISRDSWGPGALTIDINQVNTTVDLNSMSASFANEATYRATASLWFDFTSPQPTVYCTHTFPICPNIELTNMRLHAQLKGIRPVAGDATRLGFDEVLASFYFDRNLANTPDWLITPLVEIDDIIRNNVQKNVERALDRTASRTALYGALTELANRMAKFKNSSSGIELFHNAWYERAGTLVVDYQPCPKMGCGTMIAR